MRRSLISSISLVLFALVGVACKDSSRGSSPQPPPAIGENENNNSNTSRELLATQVQRILEENCISCHQGSAPAAGMDMTNEATIIARAEDIADFILDDRLPATEGLTYEEVELIRAWKAAGYPRPKSKAPPKNGTGGGKPGKDDPGKGDPSQNDYGKDKPGKGKDDGKYKEGDKKDRKHDRIKRIRKKIRCWFNS